MISPRARRHTDVTTLDDDDDDGSLIPARRRRWRTFGWRSRLLAGLLVLIGLCLLVLVPWLVYLDHQLTARLETFIWQEPTRVYARPLWLAPGLVMDAQTLRIELDAAGYRDGDGIRPGTWQRSGARWMIASRGVAGLDGVYPPGRIALTLDGGEVTALDDAASGQSLDMAYLDAARIATLYGPQQDERRLVRLAEVPVLLTDTLQAVEDRNFARHPGVDVGGMVRALWVNLGSGETRQGASTLTQQLARSGVLDIGGEQTLWRKFNEVLYALLIERRYDKAQILEAYLNQVYLGQRGAQAIHGVLAGAEFWFSRPLEELDSEHVALLVGIIRGPSYYDPRRHPERARERRDAVLLGMRQAGLIDEADYTRALAAPLGISTAPGQLAANPFPAYVDLVRRQLDTAYPDGTLHGAGFSILTAFAPSAQRYAEAAVARTVADLQTAQRPLLQAGLVLTDIHTGEIIAAVGSRNRLEHGFNRAADVRRPVGSLLKPLVYVLALAQPQRFSLATWLEDAPLSITLTNGQRWAPDNSDGVSHGRVRLLDALAHSYNQAAVALGVEVQPERLVQFIHSVSGVRAEANPALILGALDESPYALAQLYQFLASGGAVQPLRTVRGVLDHSGNVHTRYDAAPAPARDGDATATALVTLALQQAMRSGTGRQVMYDGLARLQPAGKTGTSNDGRDSWFAGWTGDHLAVIWVGNDDNAPIGLTGASGALRVWSWLFQRLPSRRLQVDDSALEWHWVLDDASTDAGCRDARRFAFARGFAPPYRSCPQPAADAVPVSVE